MALGVIAAKVFGYSFKISQFSIKHMEIENFLF